MPSANTSTAVEIVEVGARDGLQNEKSALIATPDKLGLIERLLAAGIRRLEVASFVNPKRVPQMADAEAVIAGLPDVAGASYIGLCLNKRGVLRALEARAHARPGHRGIDEVGCVVIASDTFGERNQGQTIAEGIAENAAMLKLAREGGLKAQVTIGVAFGCPFEGEVPVATVVGIATAMAEAGAQEIALADTIGVAVPAQVTEVVGRVREAVPGLPLRVHFHNTRGAGIANAWAAWLAGIRTFDASIGGLGGCPFAPRATGNIATEELVYMLQRSGIASGVDLDALIAVNRWFEPRLGRQMPSLVARAGNWPQPAPAAA